jgi:predicted TIM-barrel fold metal-dependent hydrolase
MVLARLSRSFEAGTPMNPAVSCYNCHGQTVADYVRGLIRDGRVVVGIEGGESELPYAINAAGEQAFVFSSDFPHEVNRHTVQKEIRELQDNEEISVAAKEAILYSNAARFYGIKH